MESFACFFCADKKDGLAVCDGVAHEPAGIAQHFEGFLQVNNVDAVALGVNVGLHLRVPAATLVSEVHPSFQKLFHGYINHENDSFRVVILRRCNPQGLDAYEAARAPHSAPMHPLHRRV
ncbi:MAG: hypothetical protein KatS3mg130_1683 [Candidatus Sumerlaea sp.]|nr:MAG: hypothetical protein KatS3mg130_1683 [Candidatus Sumerlaea sp.]